MLTPAQTHEAALQITLAMIQYMPKSNSDLLDKDEAQKIAECYNTIFNVLYQNQAPSKERAAL